MELRRLRIDVPTLIFSFSSTHAKSWRSSAGTKCVLQLEPPPSQAGELSPDCSKANEFVALPAASKSRHKNHSRENPRQTLVFRWLPRYPCRRPGVGKRAACS